MIRLGPVQESAIRLYVLDPACVALDGPPPLSVSGGVLTTDDAEAAWQTLTDAAKRAAKGAP